MVVGVSRTARGLQQTSAPLILDKQSELLSRQRDFDPHANLDPDANLALPPPGDYEFYSIPAATLLPVLLGLDAVKGMMHVWLPGSEKWESLEHVDRGRLASSRIKRSHWRCEAVCEDLQSTLFLPTEEGLACVKPDAIGLCYQVSYIGGACVVGAPVQFSEHVWAPLCASGGTLKLISATVSGHPDEAIECSIPVQVDWTSEPFHPPLADGRMALWPHFSGQLVLRKLASGTLDVRFIRWPDGVRPVFEFGSAFLARDGDFWQLCFDSTQDCYVYLQLGVERPEIHTATAPRLCTGSFNFRFASRYRTAPWHEPEHGDDSRTDEVVLPLLESVANSSVIGLRMATTQGLADVLKSNERMRIKLVLDDDTTQTAFYTLSVAEPWRMRVFIHDGRLWAYHPLINRMEGWDLPV
jgi:hypothetical protein